MRKTHDRPAKIQDELSRTILYLLRYGASFTILYGNCICVRVLFFVRIEAECKKNIKYNKEILWRNIAQGLSNVSGLISSAIKCETSDIVILLIFTLPPTPPPFSPLPPLLFHTYKSAQRIKEKRTHIHRINTYSGSIMYV